MHSFNCESVAQKKNVLLTITVMPESRQTRSNQLFPGGEQHPILTIEPPSPMPEDNSHRSGAKKTLHIFEQQEDPKFLSKSNIAFWCSCSKTFPKATSATSSSNEGSPSCFECSTEGKPLQRQDSSDRERSSLSAGRPPCGPPGLLRRRGRLRPGSARPATAGRRRARSRCSSRWRRWRLRRQKFRRTALRRLSSFVFCRISHTRTPRDPRRSARA